MLHGVCTRFAVSERYIYIYTARKQGKVWNTYSIPVYIIISGSENLLRHLLICEWGITHYHRVAYIVIITYRVTREHENMAEHPFVVPIYIYIYVIITLYNIRTCTHESPRNIHIK